MSSIKQCKIGKSVDYLLFYLPSLKTIIVCLERSCERELAYQSMIIKNTSEEENLIKLSDDKGWQVKIGSMAELQ